MDRSQGHDTTTTAISWTLLLLGNHPDVQDAVRAELESIFKHEQRAISLKDLGQMKLLERVIKESLRLYPSVTIISRLLDEDVKLGEKMALKWFITNKLTVFYRQVRRTC